MRRSCVLVAIVAVAAGPAHFSPRRLGAQEEVGTTSRVRAPLRGDRIERRTIERALGYLRGQANPTGSIGKQFPVAVTALAGLAFLAAGNSYDEGPYNGSIQQALDYLLGSQDDSGFISEGTGTDGQSRLHGHCFALLFLTQVYGELPPVKARQVRIAITQACKCLLRCQSFRGGWDYSPDNRTADEASITICALQALRGARNAGFAIPRSVVDRATKYVEDCQVESTGAFRYSLSRNRGETTFSLTAAALSTLYAAGVYDSPILRKGMDNLRGQLDRVGWRPRRAVNEPFYYYGAFYASQVFHQVGGEDWRKWYSGLRNELLRRQDTDGSWDDPKGKEYATAMAALMLEMPIQYLPIFQR